jgi:hypothetical protein
MLHGRDTSKIINAAVAAFGSRSRSEKDHRKQPNSPPAHLGLVIDWMVPVGGSGSRRGCWRWCADCGWQSPSRASLSKA